MSDYVVGFWNLENLFAPEGFAGREPWLASRLAGWTDDVFDRKLVQLASVIPRGQRIGGVSGGGR